MENKKTFDVNNIPFLPKRLYKQYYGADYSDSWKLEFNPLKEHERVTLRALLECSDFREVYRVPEVKSPTGKKASDLFIDGHKVELKRASGRHTIENRIHEANEQLGGNGDGWVFLNTTTSYLSLQTQLAEVKKRMAQIGVKRYGVVSHGVLVTYEQKNDPAIAVNANHDPKSSYTSILPQNPKDVNTNLEQNSSEHTAHPNRDPELFYISILPQDVQKVNRKIAGNARYWGERAEERLVAAEKRSKPYLRRIQENYRGAAEKIVEEMRAIYAAYYRKDGTFNMAALNMIPNDGSLQKFKNEMKRAGLSTELPNNYRGRMNRLELLNAQVWAEVRKAGIKEQRLNTELYSKTIQEAYHKTSAGVLKLSDGEVPTHAFATLDSKIVDRVLGAKFYGRNYSERIWHNTSHMAEKLQGVISKAITVGQSPEKTIREIQTLFNVKKSDAARLVRTETNYFQNQGEIESFKELGIERYSILATLDTRTSEVCRYMDKRVFYVKDATAGLNMPPFHPYCRSTITPYFGEEFEPEKRIMRDPETGKNATGHWTKMTKHLASGKIDT